MRPNKKILLRAQQRGAIYIINRVLSCNHLLMSTSANLLEECDFQMSEVGLKMGSLKQTINRALTASYAYTDEFEAMIPTKIKDQYWCDFYEFEKAIRHFAGITKEDIALIKEEFADKGDRTFELLPDCTARPLDLNAPKEPGEPTATPVNDEAHQLTEEDVHHADTANIQKPSLSPMLNGYFCNNPGIENPAAEASAANAPATSAAMSNQPSPEPQPQRLTDESGVPYRYIIRWGIQDGRQGKFGCNNKRSGLAEAEKICEKLGGISHLEYAISFTKVSLPPRDDKPIIPTPRK